MEAAKVCSGGSTVPAAVVIVVKYRACLSVGRLIVGVQAQSFAQAVGVTAQSLSGLFRRRISTVSYLFGSQAYWYESLYGCRSSVYWYKGIGGHYF